MTEFEVVTDCGITKDGFETRSEAEDGADVHEALCDQCTQGDTTVQPITDETTGAELINDGDAEVVESQPPTRTEEYDLPEQPSLTDDPLSWVPGDFVDRIDGEDAINRKGYAVLAHHFGVEVPGVVVEVGPEETEFTYCRVRATAVTEDNKTHTDHGSAHVDRGDDAELLLEMASTRARKRALASATGVGMIAVEELKNDLQ